MVSDSSQRLDSDWPFDQPRNCASMTTLQVLDGTEPILLVCHDADDGGWQFIGVTGGSVENGRVVGLGRIVQRDPTLLELADLPLGWRAVREKVGAAWKRQEQSA